MSAAIDERDKKKTPGRKERLLNRRQIYSGLLSFAGLVIIILGLLRFPQYENPSILLLLLFFAIATQSTMTYLVGGNVSVSVSGAISFAVVGLYGPVAAGMAAAIAEVGLWLLSLRPKDRDWNHEIERLGVNGGIHGVSILLGGLVFVWVRDMLGTGSFIADAIPWFAGAIVGDQVNFWLLSIIIYLANGVSPKEVFRENRWAIPMNVLVMSVGGGLIMLAVAQFGLLGLAIFVLPIILSAYSFRVTVNNAKKQMVELEEMVTLRTQALANANHELEALHKEKDSFLAVLTHDMRTPLTSIRGYGSIMRDRELTREQQTKIAKVILNSQDTLLEIVNNILELEKLQSGVPILLESSNFDVALLVKNTAESLETQALEKKITLNYDQVPSPIMITADMSKIRRVILNLISNALKYTPEDGLVSVRTMVNGRFAIFEVEDNGYGIPADELPHIFDRYSRVKGHRHLAIGTGLGLAIVKSLIEAHDGEISVQSEENVGSTFTFKLPLT
ncbi:sensor histidine kinase [Candidatus Leptofilum sp.]|uniref:sensor histidine kinase n=1 Tax=Candidatus Leptofilum sp. TaxID=3241576 RepID=UPI003B5C86CE